MRVPHPRRGAARRACPSRRDRSEAEAEAAALLRSELDAARARFLRVHADAVYDALTDDLRLAVRDEELVYAAADRFPGLVPTRAQMAAERTQGPARQGGHRDRAGPVPLVRARVASLRRASRLVDAAPDRGGARAPRRVPGDRRRRPRRDVPRAPRAGGVSRDPERPPPERGGLRHAPDHRGRGRPGAARPRGRGGRHPRRGRHAIRATPAGASSARASTSRTCTTAASTTCSSSRAISAT